MNCDITWLPNSLLKDIPEVKVLYVEDVGQSYGGFYAYNSRILEIVYTDDTIYTMESAIAHEFCHFIQEVEGRQDNSPIKWEIKGTYADSINHFFHRSENEMEALLWQNKYAKDESSEWWLRKLVMKE